MATIFSNTLHPSYSPVANIRANAQFVEDTLVAVGGWGVTSDANQTIPASLPIPTTNNQKVGFRIYRMNDALQTNFPVVMRVDYGSSQFSGQGFKFWITIGLSSDGSGNITDRLLEPVGFAPGTNSFDPTAVTNSYGSAAGGRATIALFCGAPTGFGSPNWTLFFSIERSKNFLGEDTGDGLMVTGTMGINLGVDGSIYLICAVGPQPALEAGISYIITAQNPSQSLGGDVGVGVVSFFKGIAQQPGVNLLIVNANDAPFEASFFVIIYGVSHTYQHLGSQIAATKTLCGQPAGTLQKASDTVRVCMRYE